MARGFCCYCSEPVEWENNQGWKREFCEDCAQEVADGAELQEQYDTGTGEPL
jgi:predicted amidophosphoribosyltransferase